jgi:Fe-S oxidoreductase
MILSARADIVQMDGLPWITKLALSLLNNEFYHGIAFSLSAFAQRFGLTRVIPRNLYPLGIDLNNFPLAAKPFRKQIPEQYPSIRAGERAVFFVGCMVDHSLPNIGFSTLRVLQKIGVQLVVPDQLKCCGIPSVVSGDIESARRLALHNLEILNRFAFDHVLTVCATCGDALKNHYLDLAKGTRLADAAIELTEKVRDISEFLLRKIVDLKLRNVDLNVTYHDPCHLIRGQNISDEPREIIKTIPGIQFSEMDGADDCCGGAGLFQISVPEEAWKITRLKMKNIQANGSDAVITSCPGCIQRLQAGFHTLDMQQVSMHLIELLDLAMVDNQASFRDYVNISIVDGQRASVPIRIETGKPRIDINDKMDGPNGSVNWWKDPPSWVRSTKPGKPEAKLARCPKLKAIPRDKIWSCTTCYACVEVCPVSIDPTNLLLEIRRYLVETGDIPESAATVLEDYQHLGSPWGKPHSQRLNWIGNDKVRIIQPGEEVEYLYWAGDTASFEAEAQSIPRAMIRLLQSAGVNYGILGINERTDGEIAHVLGEHGLFERIVHNNIEQLSNYKFKAILTHCPHTYTILKNEYQKYGDAINVVHHSQWIDELIQKQVIQPTCSVDERVTYHDPCYLGRHNGIYDEPRRIIQNIPGCKLVEMEQSRKDSPCCGAGGGMIWLDSYIRKRLNYERLDSIEDLEIRTIATACPYCMLMIKEAVKFKQLEETIRIVDISELILESRIEKVT